jgi:hypothetical protein
MQAAFGRFIRPGSQIIESGDSNTIAALVPSTGNLVIIVRNGGTASASYTFDLSKFTPMTSSVHVYQYLVSAYQTLSKLPDVAISNKQFTITAPAQSITSCAIPGVVTTGSTSTINNAARMNDIALSKVGEHSMVVRLSRQGRVDLRLFDGAGKIILKISKEGNPGDNVIDFGRPLIPEGVYFADIAQGNSLRQAMVKVLRK